jgi:TgpA N-terminal domain
LLPGVGKVPPGRKITIIAAIACVLASVVLAPLFIGALWFVTATGAVITAAGAGALTRLRPLPVPACLAAGLAGLGLYLNLIFEARHSLLLVIPTPGSLTRLWDLAGTGMHEANLYTGPARDLPGLLLLAAGGIGITAVLADLIAVRLRFTALTGLPLLVLPSVPVMVNAGHDLFVTGLVFCLGAAGYLATLAAAGRAGADGAALAMAVPVGLTGIALALCSPLLLPAVSLGQLLSPSASTGPLTQTMAQLHKSRPTVVSSYTTSAPPRLQRSDPRYFQQYAVDTLDDAGSPTARTAADPARPRAGLLLRGSSRARASQVSGGRQNSVLRRAIRGADGRVRDPVRQPPDRKVRMDPGGARRLAEGSPPRGPYLPPAHPGRTGRTPEGRGSYRPVPAAGRRQVLLAGR